MKFNVFWLFVLALVNAHTVLLPPYGKQCFFEMLKQNDVLSTTFQVGSRDPNNAEQLTVDFVISDPRNRIECSLSNIDHGDETIKASVDGKYQYCFSNEKSSRADLEVSFNVHGVIYYDALDANSNSLDYSILRLKQLTSDVKAEQNYLVIRERTHRNTAESTNSRVKWWSLFQIVMVAMNCLFQIYYLRRFFEVRSVV